MSTKTLGWILTIFPIVGLLSWLLSGLPTDPAGELEGGYSAYAALLKDINADRIHVFMGLASITFGVITISLVGLRMIVGEKSKSSIAFLSGGLLIVGFAGTIAENGAFSAATSLAQEGLLAESVSMLTIATTAGGYATSIMSLGILFLGISLYQTNTVHIISSVAFMITGLIGIIGGILFYDSGPITAFYASFTITTVAIGIELIRTGAD
tara:strand:+ start:16 stop:648 length:633 start_codon:yes stop_codon:yes gene_type:complete